MKLRNLFCIVLLIFTLSLTGYANTYIENDELNLTLTEVENNAVKKTYSVLFIGNSYTYYNDMPTSIFKRIAESAGYEVDVTAITKGSHKLSQFADPTDEYGAKVEKALTGTEKYDFVILQEQSILPAGENALNFYAAVRNLTERIRETGANPVLYSTWGRKEGSDTLETHGWTNESMTWKLAAGYQAIGDELGIPVAHVGLAFYDVYTNQSSIELYNADMSHPSYAGSYLAASTLFAKIFNANPMTVSFNGDLSVTNANILREAARKAVFETPSIPKEDKTEKIYFTNYSFTRKSGNLYQNDPGIYGVNGSTHDIRSGGQYYGYVQLDLTGYEEILANDNTSVKVSIYAGPYTTTTRKCGDFYAYLVNDAADTKYVGTVTTQKQANSLGMHNTTRPTLFVKSDGTIVSKTRLELEADVDALVSSLNEGSDNSLVTLYLHPKGASGDLGYLSPFYINPKISYLEIFYDESEVDNQAYVNDITLGITWDKITDDDINNITKNLPTFYKGASISWEASVPGIVSPNGEITPPLGETTDVTLTATFTYKDASTTAIFDATVAPEQAVEVKIPFTNYAFSRSSATNTNDAKNHAYKFGTFNGIDCIQTGGSYDGYVQLDLKGYEEILNNPYTTATISLEAGYEFSTARLNPVIGKVAPDSADGYDNMTITWNIANKLGIHKSTNPVLFETTESGLTPGQCAVASADMSVLANAINNSTNSIITLYIEPNGADSKIRASKSGLTISYYKSQIDDEAFFADIESGFAWDKITSDAPEAVVNNLPNYYKGADIVWSSGEGSVTSSGELVTSDGALIKDNITANVSYKDYSFTREFNVTVCDGKISFSEPAITIENNTATANISVVNGTDKDVTYKLYLATYIEGKLIELVPFDFKINKGSELSKELEADYASGNTVKFFVWENDSINPVLAVTQK